MNDTKENDCHQIDALQNINLQILVSDFFCKRVSWYSMDSDNCNSGKYHSNECHSTKFYSAKCHSAK